MRRLALPGALAVLAALGAVASDAQAGYRSAPQPGGYAYAESRWGHGSVSGPVRRSRNGYQVRLPGGTWVDCVRNNCSETLRVQTVDIFETMGTSPVDGGPRYFRWERRF